jgi:RNAse (barnase) inhibitor barstar
MASLLQLLVDLDRAGVYQTNIGTDEIVAAAKTVGFEVFRINLTGARGKRALLDRIATSLGFPPHFGRNWDALNDCLSDLDNQSKNGWLLLLTGATGFAQTYEQDFQTTLDVFATAADYWRKQKRAFWVLLHAPGKLSDDLPLLVAN